MAKHAMPPRGVRSGKVGASAQQGSSSFLKKRTKKLLLLWFSRPVRPARIEEGKSFLVLFFKKELLRFWPTGQSPSGLILLAAPHAAIRPRIVVGHFNWRADDGFYVASRAS
jgi:hypothetical protein